MVKKKKPLIMKDGSGRFQIDQKILKSTFRNALIIYGSVFALFLDQIQAWTINTKILWWATLAITIDLLRRWYKDYTNIK